MAQGMFLSCGGCALRAQVFGCRSKSMGTISTTLSSTVSSVSQGPVGRALGSCVPSCHHSLRLLCRKMLNGVSHHGVIAPYKVIFVRASRRSRVCWEGGFTSGFLGRFDTLDRQSVTAMLKPPNKIRKSIQVMMLKISRLRGMAKQNAQIPEI